jgi:hypothetical protein
MARTISEGRQIEKQQRGKRCRDMTPKRWVGSDSAPAAGRLARIDHCNRESG